MSGWGAPWLGSSCLAQAAFSPGSHRGGLLTGLHPGAHAWCLPVRGDGTLARPALRCLRPAVYFLLPARDPAPREAGKGEPRKELRGPRAGGSVLWAWGDTQLVCQSQMPGGLGCPLLVPLPLRPGTGRGGQGRFRSCPSPATWQAPPVLPLPQAPSIAPGFQAAADLLSPLALLRFSAVARGQDPPAGDSKETPPHEGGTVTSSSCPSLPQLSSALSPLLPRTQEPPPPGPGVFPLPLPVLGTGVHAQLPCPPALPVQQVGLPAP